ncbi:MAG: hypothetical protein P1U40_04790 [Coxiellaceae bacterium]|nr:hypothetical protein [Coxiellaceae bacterium]
MLKKIIFCAGAMALGLSSSAIAGKPAPLLSTVSFQSSVQGWIKTDTAKVIVAVAAGSKSSNVSSQRQAIMQRLAGLYPKVQWRITSMSFSKDQSGLVNLRLYATARLPEKDTSTLNQKLTKLNRSGEQYKVQSMAFVPTLQEMNTAKMQLRDQLYQQVNKEVAALNKTYNKQYYPANIQFISAQPRPMPMMYMKAASASNEATHAAGSSPQLANQITLTANVKLAAKADNATT